MSREGVLESAKKHENFHFSTCAPPELSSESPLSLRDPRTVLAFHFLEVYQRLYNGIDKKEANVRDSLQEVLCKVPEVVKTSAKTDEIGFERVAARDTRWEHFEFLIGDTEDAKEICPDLGYIYDCDGAHLPCLFVGFKNFSTQLGRDVFSSKKKMNMIGQAMEHAELLLMRNPLIAESTSVLLCKDAFLVINAKEMSTMDPYHPHTQFSCVKHTFSIATSTDDVAAVQMVMKHLHGSKVGVSAAVPESQCLDAALRRLRPSILTIGRLFEAIIEGVKRKIPLCHLHAHLSSVKGLSVKGVLGYGATGRVVMVERQGQPHALKLFRERSQIGASVENENIKKLDAANMSETEFYMSSEVVSLDQSAPEIYQQEALLMFPVGKPFSLRHFRVLGSHPFVKAVEHLRALHSRGFLHRDARRENILILEHDSAMLIDYGYLINSTCGEQPCVGSPDALVPQGWFEDGSIPDRVVPTAEDDLETLAKALLCVFATR